MLAEASDPAMMSLMVLCLTILLGGLFANQAVLPLSVHQSSAAAYMSNTDTAAKMQSNLHMNCIILLLLLLLIILLLFLIFFIPR